MDFTTMSATRVILGCGLILVYVFLCLIRWSQPVMSQVGVGAAGVFLQVLAIAAGLGICAVLRLHFNAATLQVIPFLSLALGLHNLLILARASSYIANINSIEFQELIGVCLKQNGLAVLLTDVITILAFVMVTLVPIPALRVFCHQAAILCLFSSLTNLLVFMALVSLDLHRRQQGRIDVFCCFSGANMIFSEETNQSTRSFSSLQVEETQRQTPSQRPPKEAPWSRHTQQQQLSRLSRRDGSPPPPYEVANWLQRAVSRTDEDGENPHTVLEPQGQGRNQHQQLPRRSYRGAHELEAAPETDVPTPGPPSTSSSQQCLAPETAPSKGCLSSLWSRRRQWSVQWFITTYWASKLQKTPVKVVFLVIFALLLGLSVLGITRMKDGLELTDFVPRGTVEYDTATVRAKYFGYYNVFIATKDIDYPRVQHELMELHDEFRRVQRIIKEDDGSLPGFWLPTMRDWLLDIQSAFLAELPTGCFNEERVCNNATDKAKLGYILLAQTGDSMSPVNKNRIFTNRLVSDDGTINKAAFYYYLSAWYGSDAIAADAAQAGFHPEPERWIHSPTEENFHIAPSAPLELAWMPFQLSDCGNTENITETVTEMRDICDGFTARGLYSFPMGVPFTFWEQYFRLRSVLTISLIVMMATIFIWISLVLLNPVIAFLVTLASASTVIQLMGLMGFIGLKMNAVSAVGLIVSTGITIQYFIHIAIRFLTNLGDRYQRMYGALDRVCTPVFHGGVIMLLGSVMLAFAEFDFIYKYFFQVFTCTTLIGLINGLVFFPVFLTWIGPSSEVLPADSLLFPLPTLPVPLVQRSKPKPSRSQALPSRPSKKPRLRKIPSDLSLTTISEEPSHISTSSAESNHHSSDHNVHVQPKFVVEATTNQSDFADSETSSCSSAASSPPPPPRRGVRTKVKATATINVEVHTPMSGSKGSKPKKRKSQDSSAESETAFTINEKDVATSNC